MRGRSLSLENPLLEQGRRWGRRGQVGIKGKIQLDVETDTFAGPRVDGWTRGLPRLHSCSTRVAWLVLCPRPQRLWAASSLTRGPGL